MMVMKVMLMMRDVSDVNDEGVWDDGGEGDVNDEGV